MMQSVLTNWKTSASGAVLIALGVLELFGVSIPGFTMDPGTAFAAGLMGLLASDGRAASNVPVRDVPEYKGK